MELLAKSKDPSSNDPARTLQQHMDDCLVIFSFLHQTFPKAAELSGIGDDFWHILYTCIVCHDLGKAHKEFQKILNGDANSWNSQRHELFSLPFVDALSMFDAQTIKIIRLVVAGHHKDYEQLATKLNYYTSGNNFGQLEGVEEEKESFETAFSRNINLERVKLLLTHYPVTFNEVNPKPIYGLIHGYLQKTFDQEHPDYFKVMFLFGGLKWCDHLGSARVINIQKIEIRDFDFLTHQKAALQLKGFDFYVHQNECSNTVGNLILTAPTGSGKTESAFLWLRKQLETCDTGRVFYVLPFTASINAMYERLNKAIGNEKVGMVHGKLSDYLNNYFDDLQYDLKTKKTSIKEIREKFKSIITPIKVCTPFQLLKHLFGLRGYEQGIFEMSGCYLIFDEIHAYSPDVFAQIKVLLEFATKFLQAKVIIMTATMPRFLQTELEQAIGKFFVVKANQELFDSFKRHRIILSDGLLIENLDVIKSQLSEGKKVLVVCNTVKAAQLVFLNLKKYITDDNSVLLHGSFNGKDRTIKEKKLKTGDIKLLVGTQAIEVSLDIDYDLIFTEPAPIDALIQRFGRVNRKREKGICDCIVFKENNESDSFIYNTETISKTLIAFQKIISENDGIIDESILQNSIDFVYDSWNAADKEEFDRKYNYLTEALVMLSPMLKNKHTEEDLCKKERCWAGYEPTPGKKAFSKGSCRKI